MPNYDYHCDENGQTVEVYHDINTKLKTWGEVCYAAQHPLGDTDVSTPVRLVIRPVSISVPISNSKLKEHGFTKLVKRDDGVYEGQAVVDALGLVGQVISVSTYTSRVLLIADTAHAVPVSVNRNGFRAVALGSGGMELLQLSHVPDTADIRQGDLLVTSGLGGRFPAGYPVAEVMEVTHRPGKPFAEVNARPLAQLERSRYVLLLNPKEQDTKVLKAEDSGTVETLSEESDQAGDSNSAQSGRDTAKQSAAEKQGG